MVKDHYMQVEVTVFFKSVSHQLYVDSRHYLAIRNTAVQYLKENPERFIESILHRSWSQYLYDMFLQGIQADHLVIQAVSDSFDLNNNIIESNEQLLEIIVIQAINPGLQNVRSIYLCDIDEMHYLLTLPALPIPQENSNHTLNDVLDSTSRSNELAQNISKRKVEEDKKKKQCLY